MTTAAQPRDVAAGNSHGTAGRGRKPRRVTTFVAAALSLTALLGLATVTTAATPSAVATSTAPPTAGDTPTPAPSTGEGAPSAGPGFTSISVATASSKIAVGASVKVELRITTSADVGSVSASLDFAARLLKAEKVEVGPVWPGAPLHLSLGTADATIAQANTSGVLGQITVAVPPVPGRTSVDGAWLIVTMTGIADGTSPLGLAVVNVLDPSGASIEGVSTADAQLVVGGGAAASQVPGTGNQAGDVGSWVPSLPVLLAFLPVLLFLVCVVLLRYERSGTLAAMMRRWPYGVSLVLGLLPVVLFMGVVLIVVVNSIPAVSDPGLPALLGSQFAGIYSATGDRPVYGLLPALCGTVLITAIAMLLALPVSLALAIVSTEFSMGPVGRVVRPLVGVLSGIPPIVYAVSVLFFVQGFMNPKFAADSVQATFDPARIGANPATWPPADVPFNAGSFPWIIGGGGGNSTLLGGILIAMLLIPFMTPMIADAIRNVPSSAREASLALGANRAYTLRKAILPMAMPGMVTALTLGTLKAVGDIVIVSFAVGWSADSIPTPIFDVLERPPGLADHGANMLEPITLPGQVGLPTPTAVGYVSALVLLIAAGAMVLGMTYLKARWRRRMAA